MSGSMAFALSFSLGLVALLPGTVEPSPFGPEQAPTFLNSEVRNFDNNGEPLVPTLLRISGTYRIPMGIEQVTPESLSRGVVVRLARGTVADLLNLCVAQISGYAWTTQDGAIDIYGQKEWADASNLFNLPLRSFIVRDATLNDANNHLRELVFAAAAKPEPGGSLHGPVGTGGDSPGVGALEAKRVNIEIENKNVRSVLNRMAVLSESCGQQVVWVANLPPTELAGTAKGGLWKLVPVGNAGSVPKPDAK
jgi:hypothetical protein